MSPSIAVPSGSADDLLGAARTLHGASNTLRVKENSCRAAVTLLQHDWTGPRSREFTAAAQGVLVEMVTLRDSLETAATAVQGYAAALRHAQSVIGGYARQHADATRSAAQSGASGDVHSQQREAAHATQLEGYADGEWRTLRAAAHRAAAALDRESELLCPGGSVLDPSVIRRVILQSVEPTAAGRAPGSLADAWAALAGAQRVEGAEPPTDIPYGKDAQHVATWWSTLTPAQQEWLIANDYGDLHDLRGLPATVADEVNRMQMADDVVSAKTTLANLPAYTAKWNAQSPENRAGMQSPATMAGRAQQVLNIANGLQGALDRTMPPDGPPAYLLTYDPSYYDYNGRAAVAYGNPDTADNTAVVVPGTGHDVAHIPTGDAGSLYAASRAQDPDKSLSVIVDLSYQPPPDLTQAVKDSWAEDGNGTMRDDINGYEVAHQQATGQHGHTTVVAHSYGTYTTGLALKNGLKVDDVVFVGSPGVGVNSVKDLHMSGDHVFDGRSNLDLIGVADDWFTPGKDGNGPEDPEFGATRFGVDNTGGHSDYFKPGSESLNNISRIVVGQSSKITPDH